MCNTDNKNNVIRKRIGRNRTLKSGKLQKTRSKIKLQVLGNIDCGHHQTKNGERKKSFKCYLVLQQEKSHQNDKHMNSPCCKILWTIPKKTQESYSDKYRKG